MIAFLLLLVLVMIILASWVTLLRDYNKYSIPGPRPLPLVGNALNFVTKPSEFIPLLHNLRVDYGDAYRVYFFHNPYVILSHPKYVEPLVSHNDLITKGRSYYYLRPWLGNGLLTSADYRWRSTRKFLTPAFHFNILQNFLPVFLKNEKILIRKLHNYADGKPFDVFPVMALTALDNVTESIMGVSIEAQTNSESKYVKSIETVSKIISMRMRNPFTGEDAIFNVLPYKRDQDDALKVLHSQTQKVITMRREELKNTNVTGFQEYSETGIKNKHAFLDLLLLSTVDGKKISDEHVREEVDTFMFEGHDTTTSGISFTLYCLAKHPEIQDKILEEQRSLLGNSLDRDPSYAMESNFVRADNSNLPKVDAFMVALYFKNNADYYGAELKNIKTAIELKEMRYLEQVIKESLRLYPSVPVIERLMVRDTEIAGLKIRKGSSVVVNIIEMHRHPDIYDSPLEFRPERHDSAASNSAKNAFSWLAFSAGPRNCIGQKFAMMELKVIVASVIKNFIVLPAESDAAEPPLCAELILRSEIGVNIKLKPRNKNC